MRRAVLDASVAIDWLVQGTAHREIEEFDSLVAPTHFDAEVANGLRRIWLAGEIHDTEFAERALRIPRLPVARCAWLHLLPRTLALAATIAMYDAAYVAIAEELGAPLCTLDSRLTRAPSAKCAFILLSHQR